MRASRLGAGCQAALHALRDRQELVRVTDTERHTLALLQMLVELFRRANDCEIQRNRLRHELGRRRLFPSAFEQAKPFKEDELL